MYQKIKKAAKSQNEELANNHSASKRIRRNGWKEEFEKNKIEGLFLSTN